MQSVIFNICLNIKFEHKYFLSSVVFRLHIKIMDAIFSEAFPRDNNSTAPLSVMLHKAGHTCGGSWTGHHAEHFPYFMPHKNFSLSFMHNP